MRLILLAAVVALAPAAWAQAATDYGSTSLTAEPSLPRTPDGHPDFQAVVWAANFFPVFEANPMSKTLVVSEAEAKAMVAMMVKGMMASDDPNIRIDPEVGDIIGGSELPLVRGERRTRTLVMPADGKLPMTAEARKEAKETDTLDGPLTDPEARPTGERCVVLNAPPISSTISYTRFRIVQTPDAVVMHSENGDEARIIPFATQHRPVLAASWLGDSIARWEGDTLVIETIGLRKETRVRGLPSIIVSTEAKVIERVTRLSQTELLYQYTVEDPKVYTAPWLAEYSLHAADTGMFPGNCHEGDYSLANTLKAARVKEERAANRR
jgi:hypothetical protein